MSEQGKSRRGKKMLTAEQKYELWLAMVRGEATQRELADRWGVDRSTVTRAAEIAKHGAISALEASKPGKPGGAGDPRAQELREAQAEIDQLTEVIKEQAIELAMLRGNSEGPGRPHPRSCVCRGQAVAARVDRRRARAGLDPGALL